MPSYKGKCTVGKNKLQRTIIAHNLLLNSKNICDAGIKAQTLKNAAQKIEEITPENERLYINIPACKVTRGYFSILPYSNSTEIYRKDETGNYELISSNSSESMSYIENINYMDWRAKKGVKDVQQYYNNPEHHKNINQYPFEKTTEEDIQRLLDIMS